MKVPSNHRQAERKLIRFVESGEWSIDDEGRIWRMRTWRGNPIKPRRAEKRGGKYLGISRMKYGVYIIGFAHRLVWQHFFGDIPDGLIINHINGAKKDNRPSNLELATYGYNAQHAHRVLNAGRDQRGEKNHATKLTRAQIIDMRRRRAAGESLDSLAASFATAFQTVSKIVRGERWAHIGGPITIDDDWRVRAAAKRERGADGRFR